MEIRYQRPVTYSIDLDVKKERELAKHLNITRNQLKTMVAAESLLEEFWDEVVDWINNNEQYAEFDATSQLEDLEID